MFIKRSRERLYNDTCNPTLFIKHRAHTLGGSSIKLDMGFDRKRHAHCHHYWTTTTTTTLHYRHGHTCLMIACYKGHANIVEILLKAGAAVNRTSSKENTAFHDCTEQGSVETAKLLQRYGATWVVVMVALLAYFSFFLFQKLCILFRNSTYLVQIGEPWVVSLDLTPINDKCKQSKLSVLKTLT